MCVSPDFSEHLIFCLFQISGIAVGFNLVFDHDDLITGIIFACVVINLLPFLLSSRVSLLLTLELVILDSVIWLVCALCAFDILFLTILGQEDVWNVKCLHSGLYDSLFCAWFVNQSTRDTSPCECDVPQVEWWKCLLTDGTYGCKRNIAQFLCSFISCSGIFQCLLLIHSLNCPHIWIYIWRCTSWCQTVFHYGLCGYMLQLVLISGAVGLHGLCVIFHSFRYRLCHRRGAEYLVRSVHPQ